MILNNLSTPMGRVWNVLEIRSRPYPCALGGAAFLSSASIFVWICFCRCASCVYGSLSLTYCDYLHFSFSSRETEHAGNSSEFLTFSSFDLQAWKFPFAFRGLCRYLQLCCRYVWVCFFAFHVLGD